MNTVIVVQARVASTRLPGKVLLPAAGRALLEWMLLRVLAARHARKVVVATTISPIDDPIVALCRKLGVEIYRGHPQDCLDRHYQVGLATGADSVVKIPSDCPLIDPAAIDRVLDAYRAGRGEYDYVSNLHPGSWPDGNDVEVVAMRALSAAWREAEAPFDREHTTPFIWSRPERFRSLNVQWETGLDHSRTHRWVVDWPDDYALVREVIEALVARHQSSTPGLFDTQAILELLAGRPQLAERNARHRGYSYWAAAAQSQTLTQP